MEKLVILLEVHLNDKRLCRAGVGPKGVVDAIVMWVNRAARDKSGQVIPGRREEFSELSVGGLRSDRAEGDAYVTWGRPRLKIGDEIRIRVVEGPRPSRARVERRVDPKLAEKSERKYFEELKKKYAKKAAPRKPKPKRSKSRQK